MTGLRTGLFADLFTGSTVVARWAKQTGFSVLANDLEPYSHAIALGTVVPNHPPRFENLGGVAEAFGRLNRLPGSRGYVATHLCPENDDQPDPDTERMFFTRRNGARIDAIRDEIASWDESELITTEERAYLLSSLLYSASYVSNTSGVFKGFHRGWGGANGTALYRILSDIHLEPAITFDNGMSNWATRQDAHTVAPRIKDIAGRSPDLVYIDPPYNQHPYGSNYHVLTTLTLWDKPPLSPSIVVDGHATDKSAIRKDWRTLRRSSYNHRGQATAAFRDLLSSVDGRWILTSYSTDGNIPLAELLKECASQGRMRVLMQRYKRYRVSTPRMSPKPYNVEFVVLVDRAQKPQNVDLESLAAEIRSGEVDPRDREQLALFS